MKSKVNIKTNEIISAYLKFFPTESPFISLDDIRIKLDTDTLNKVYRRLAKENHPDHGGSGAIMKEINSAREVLTAYLKSPNNINIQEPRRNPQSEELNKRLDILEKAYHIALHETNSRYLRNLQNIKNINNLSEKIEKYFEYQDNWHKEVKQIETLYNQVKATITVLDEEAFNKTIVSLAHKEYRNIKIIYDFLKDILKTEQKDIKSLSKKVEYLLERERLLYIKKLDTIRLSFAYNLLVKDKTQSLSDEDKLSICEATNYNSSQQNPYTKDIIIFTKYLEKLTNFNTSPDISILKEIEKIFISKQYLTYQSETRDIEDNKEKSQIIEKIKLDLQKKLRSQIDLIIKDLQILRLSIDPQVLMRLKSDYNKITSAKDCATSVLLDFLKEEYSVMEEYLGKRTLASYQQEAFFTINEEVSPPKKASTH